MDDLVNAICGIDCKPRQDACNGYCVGKADHPPLIQRQDVMTPEGSNADEWLLFITEHSPEFVAVQIAERLDEITALRARLEAVKKERADHHKVMSKRIAMQRKELRWMNAYTNALLNGYNRILDAKNKAEARAERAEAALKEAEKERDASQANADDMYQRYMDAVEEIEELTEQLATARREAVEEAAKVADSVALPMDGKREKAQAGYMRDVIASSIRALANEAET